MTEQDVDIHNPTFGVSATVGDRRALPLPKRAQGEALTIAFVDNEKPNTPLLLELVEQGLAARYDVESRRLLKGGAAHPAPDDIIQSAVGADIAILATAD